MMACSSESNQISIREKVLFRLKNAVYSTLISRANLKTTLSSGVSLRVEDYADWIIYNEIFVNGEYRKAVEFSSSTIPNDRKANFVDLGANVGFFTLYLLDVLRRKQSQSEFCIKAVEGSPKIFSKLQSRLTGQARPHERVDLYNGLIGERSGSGTLFEIGYHAMASMTPRRLSRSVSVPFLDFEGMCSDMDVIDLLKCDIEGAEEALLRNWKNVLQKTRCAVFEFHPQNCDTEMCVTMLNDVGLSKREILRSAELSSVELFWRHD